MNLLFFVKAIRINVRLFFSQNIVDCIISFSLLLHLQISNSLNSANLCWLLTIDFITKITEPNLFELKLSTFETLL